MCKVQRARITMSPLIVIGLLCVFISSAEFQPGVLGLELLEPQQTVPVLLATPPSSALNEAPMEPSLVQSPGLLQILTDTAPVKTACVHLDGFSGHCELEQSCTAEGGVFRKDGVCAQQMGKVCCSPLPSANVRTCGHIIQESGVRFVNPPPSRPTMAAAAAAAAAPPQGAYGDPFLTGYGEQCSVLVQVPPTVCQVRLELLAFNMSQPSRRLDGSVHCRDDAFSVTTGFGSLAFPDLCGENSGQHLIVDVTQSELLLLTARLAAYVQTSRYWNIQIKFISCYDFDELAPPNCLQYHRSSVRGTVRPFNFNNAPNSALIDGFRYRVCLRPPFASCAAHVNANRYKINGGLALHVVTQGTTAVSIEDLGGPTAMFGAAAADEIGVRPLRAPGSFRDPSTQPSFLNWLMTGAIRRFDLRRWNGLPEWVSDGVGQDDDVEPELSDTKQSSQSLEEPQRNGEVDDDDDDNDHDSDNDGGDDDDDDAGGGKLSPGLKRDAVPTEAHRRQLPSHSDGSDGGLKKNAEYINYVGEIENITTIKVLLPPHTDGELLTVVPVANASHNAHIVSQTTGIGIELTPPPAGTGGDHQLNDLVSYADNGTMAVFEMEVPKNELNVFLTHAHGHGGQLTLNATVSHAPHTHNHHGGHEHVHKWLNSHKHILDYMQYNHSGHFAGLDLHHHHHHQLHQHGVNPHREPHRPLHQHDHGLHQHGGDLHLELPHDLHHLHHHHPLPSFSHSNHTRRHFEQHRRQLCLNLKNMRQRYQQYLDRLQNLPSLHQNRFSQTSHQYVDRLQNLPSLHQNRFSQTSHQYLDRLQNLPSLHQNRFSQTSNQPTNNDQLTYSYMAGLASQPANSDQLTYSYMAGLANQPYDAAGTLHKQQEGIGTLHKPQEGMGWMGTFHQQQEGSGTVFQPQEGTGTVFQPQQGTGTVFQPQQGTGTVSQPQQGTGTLPKHQEGIGALPSARKETGTQPGDHQTEADPPLQPDQQHDHEDVDEQYRTLFGDPNRTELPHLMHLNQDLPHNYPHRPFDHEDLLFEHYPNLRRHLRCEEFEDDENATTAPPVVEPATAMLIPLAELDLPELMFDYSSLTETQDASGQNAQNQNTNSADDCDDRYDVRHNITEICANSPRPFLCYFHNIHTYRHELIRNATACNTNATTDHHTHHWTYHRVRHFLHRFLHRLHELHHLTTHGAAHHEHQDVPHLPHHDLPNLQHHHDLPNLQHHHDLSNLQHHGLPNLQHHGLLQLQHQGVPHHQQPHNLQQHGIPTHEHGHSVQLSVSATKPVVVVNPVAHLAATDHLRPTATVGESVTLSSDAGVVVGSAPAPGGSFGQQQQQQQPPPPPSAPSRRSPLSSLVKKDMFVPIVVKIPINSTTYDRYQHKLKHTTSANLMLLLENALQNNKLHEFVIDVKPTPPAAAAVAEPPRRFTYLGQFQINYAFDMC